MRLVLLIFLFCLNAYFAKDVHSQQSNAQQASSQAFNTVEGRGKFSVEEIRKKGLVANLYLPNRPTLAPVVIILGGSSGGMHTEYGEFLAKNGIAALSLAYFRFDSLPDSLDNIPIEYVHNAINYLSSVNAVDSKRLGLWGASRGSELAFLTATTNKIVKSLVVTTPSKVAWHGARSRNAWTLKGQGVASLSFDKTSNKPIFERAEEALKDSVKVKKAQFAFEHVNGPILLVSAEKDRIWPSYQMSLDIEDYLKSKAFQYQVKHISYPTGHSFDTDTRLVIKAEILHHFKASFAVQ